LVLGFLAAAIFSTTPASAETIDVKKYGAKGDGVTDDQVALEKAFAAANANPNNKIFFPVGNYLHSGELVANRIDVDGAKGATLTNKTTNAVLRLTGNSVSVLNLTFATKVTGGTAILFDSGAVNYKATKVTVNEGFQFCIRAISATDGDIRGGSFAVGKSSQAIYCQSCQKIDVGLNTIKGKIHKVFEQINGIIFERCGDADAESNRFQSTDIALSVSGCTNVTLKNNVSESETGIICLNSNTLTLTDNSNIGTSHFKGAGITTTQCKFVTLEGNSARSVREGYQSNFDTNVKCETSRINDVFGGISASGSTNVNLSGNTFDESQTFGILAEDCKSSVDIDRNKLVDCGLDSDQTLAVIEVNSPGAAKISIDGNNYQGNSKTLSFFIRCLQAPPKASAAGNTTPTALPTKLGP
jgi:hypothetical protein